MTIGLLLLATHQYKQFVQPLLNDVKKYFLPNHKIEVHLFTDDISMPTEGDERVSIHKELIPSYRFPIITLYRYKIFLSKLYENCDYLFYLDVDMSIVDIVEDEILGDIVCVSHPGFHQNEGGSWCDNKESNAYTFIQHRDIYAAGGFQGGRRDIYYDAMRWMKLGIEDDEKRNVLAEWHDESFWNKFLSTRDHRFEVILDPSYCMVEQKELREQWGIDYYEPKIIALAKNHEEIRS